MEQETLIMWGIQELFLTNGNYVVSSPRWNSPFSTHTGAATWMNGTNGKDATGAGPGIKVSLTNSLYGTSMNDNIGVAFYSVGLLALTNGNYVVSSPRWNSPFSTLTGAATWMNGANGKDGTGVGPGVRVSTGNSLYGTQRNSNVGAFSGPVALTNGNCVGSLSAALD